MGYLYRLSDRFFLFNSPAGVFSWRPCPWDHSLPAFCVTRASGRIARSSRDGGFGSLVAKNGTSLTESCCEAMDTLGGNGRAEAGLDMRTTCVHAGEMSRMIQLRNVPDGLHRRLKGRAAMSGMSLSDYLLAEIRRLAERPTIAELRERMERRAGVNSPVSAADAVRGSERHGDRARRFRRD